MYKAIDDRSISFCLKILLPFVVFAYFIIVDDAVFQPLRIKEAARL